MNPNYAFNIRSCEFPFDVILLRNLYLNKFFEEGIEVEADKNLANKIEDEILDFRDNKAYEFFVASELISSDKVLPVGFVCGSFDATSECYEFVLTDLHVDSLFRNNGVGRGLLHHVSEFAKNDGCLQLVSNLDGSAYSRYLKSAGFRNSSISGLVKDIV